MARTTHDDSTSPDRSRLHVALELSLNTWKLALTTSRAGKARIRDVKARDLPGFLAEIQAAKQRLGLAEDTPVVSCYEAGRDGFWIHRFLAANGIENVVIDPASIEVNRRSRRPKTDRLDAQKLVQLLARHHDGEDVLRGVRVPSVEAEDERRLPRRLRTLKRRRVQTTNRIQAALFQHGVDLSPRKLCFHKQRILQEVKRARQWDGTPLPPELLDDVRMFVDQCDLITRQIKKLEQRQREVLRKARQGVPEATPAQQKAATVSRLRGVGDVGAYVLATEFFGWRTFNNRKEVGALAGLTGTPHQSGGPGREQGISKAGNPRVRTLMVELSWLWLRFQPKSRTTLWFHEHVGKAGSRGKRKAIVAVARKLLVELWHFVEHGVVPEGAVLTDEAESDHAQAAA
jgi:transposase